MIKYEISLTYIARIKHYVAVSIILVEQARMWTHYLSLATPHKTHYTPLKTNYAN